MCNKWKGRQNMKLEVWRSRRNSGEEMNESSPMILLLKSSNGSLLAGYDGTGKLERLTCYIFFWAKMPVRHMVNNSNISSCTEWVLCARHFGRHHILVLSPFYRWTLTSSKSSSSSQWKRRMFRQVCTLNHYATLSPHYRILSSFKGFSALFLFGYQVKEIWADYMKPYELAGCKSIFPD